MSLRTTLFARLDGYAGLSALVGSRIYYKTAPDTPAQPYVTYNMAGQTPVSAMGSDTGLVRTILQVDCYDTNADDAAAVADQVDAALRRWRTTTGTTIQDIFLTNRQDLEEPDAGPQGVERVMLSFEIDYLES